VASGGTGGLIEFTGFGDEDIHFSQNSGLILYQSGYSSVTVAITGDWVSCTWFEDGRQSWNGNGFNFEIYPWQYPAHTEHTLTAVVADGNGAYYSKTLTFKVLP
jgi:hypothetical protein